MGEKPLKDQLSAYFAQMGRKGGQTRAMRLSAEQRKKIATQASEAAAEARTRKARAKKKKSKKTR
jgi:hypothetical protein